MRYVLLLALAACTQKAAPAASTAVNFELDCASSDTATSAQLRCVRTDTRTGEVLVVEYLKLPVSNGPTATGSSAPGRFTTACAAPSTDQRADFYCVRMNTETGELLLINLTKVGTLPPKA